MNNLFRRQQWQILTSPRKVTDGALEVNNVHWKGYVVKHNYTNKVYLMAILDN